MTVTVVRAAPYLTVQDFGRTAHREFGVPRCGAMDRPALGSANAVVGNDVDAAGLEWALGGGSLRFDAPTTFALAGATAEATISGSPVDALTPTHASAGDVLEIERFSTGRFLYVAFQGGIACEELLGSRSTYLPAHFGGIAGKIIRSGENLPVTPAKGHSQTITAPIELRPDYSRRTIRVIAGPQWSLFSDADKDRFFTQRYTVSRASDRMGYRLDGEPLSNTLGLLPSEGVCEGTIQIPPNGLPIVLMADSPTVGGYPKIGVLATTDLPLLAQLNPGESFQFERTTVEESQKRVRRAATALFTLHSLALAAQR